MRAMSFWDLNSYRASFSMLVKRGPICWTWCGARNDSGVGTFKYTPAGKRTAVSVHAHRVTRFFLGDGRIPTVAEDVRHLCANPLCVRPDHLEFVAVEREVMGLAPALLEPERDRFLSHVDVSPDDCWDWKGPSRNPDRPSSTFPFIIDGVSYVAARLAPYYFAGRLVLSTETVRHRCKNQRCVRPEHLEIL